MKPIKWALNGGLDVWAQMVICMNLILEKKQNVEVNLGEGVVM